MRLPKRNKSQYQLPLKVYLLKAQMRRLSAADWVGRAAKKRGRNTALLKLLFAALLKAGKRIALRQGRGN